MPDCTICGKPYKSRSGLKAHAKTHAQRDPLTPAAFEPALGEGDNYVGPSASDDLTLPQLTAGFDPTHNKYRDAKLIDDACAALGIDAANILSFKVYDDQVVIIEGPTGFKRTWTKGESQ